MSNYLFSLEKFLFFKQLFSKKDCDFHTGYESNDFFVKANVVCKQLGFTGGALSTRCCSSFGSVPDKFSYDDVKCNGAEKTLDSWY